LGPAGYNKYREGEEIWQEVGAAIENTINTKDIGDYVPIIFLKQHMGIAALRRKQYIFVKPWAFGGFFNFDRILRKAYKDEVADICHIYIRIYFYRLRYLYYGLRNSRYRHLYRRCRHCAGHGN